MPGNLSVTSLIRQRFNEQVILSEETANDNTSVIWVRKENSGDLLDFLKNEISNPFRMLFDLTAIDERSRNAVNRNPERDFTVVYHLTSFTRNEDIRIKVPLTGEFPSIDSATAVWPAANWYEREIFDMFGISFKGHQDLRRILMPGSWKGHPLRKEYPARATELEPFILEDQMRDIADRDLKFDPEAWGMKVHDEDTDFMFLNVGPHHPGTHGLLRLVLQLDGEDIVNIVPDIGFHHRGAEKMAERQSWHTFIPYTDRIDYLGGVINNLAYLLSVEKIAGIEIPDRASVIRVMMSEFFRLASHLVWLGTYAQDLGQISPVFLAFNDRERIFDIVQAITGGNPV